MKYRAEIDGLRAVAVLPVILFHAGFEVFGGGYVGVDVFFVISGYLITTILIGEIENGRFSLVGFYERRARRILPALFFVMFACLPFAWMWLSAGQMQEFSQSLIAVTVFVSNFFFWRSSDYFDRAVEEKPLLHTWSLAVEEQYYVFFPIFLFLVWRFGRTKVFWMIVGGAALSLALSEWGARNAPSANFYLAPTRAWELFAGSITAFVIQGRGIKASNIFSVLGLAAVAFAIFAFDETTPFPSLYALVPVCGVVLLILFAGQDTLVGKILSMKPIVGVGLISYSAYLWHQPLLAFLKANTVDEVSFLVKLLFAALSLVVAYFSWRFVEAPFRRKDIVSRKMIFTLSGLGGALLIVIGAAGSMLAPKLESGRFNPLNAYGGAEANRALLQNSWRPLRDLAGTAEYTVEGNEFDCMDWYTASADAPRLLVIGNSHSKDLYNILSMSRGVSQHYLVARYGVQVRDLGADHAMWDCPNYQQASVVVIASRYRIRDVANMKAVIARVRADGKRPVIVSNIFEFPEYRNGQWNLADRALYERLGRGVGPEDTYREINRLHYEAFAEGRGNGPIKNINTQLAKIAGETGAVFLDRMDYVCDEAEKLCYGVDKSLNKTFYDYGHHTLAGAKFFADRIDALKWFPLTERNGQ